MMLSTMMPMMLLCVQAQVLISMPVTVDGVARDLKLMQGETVAMAAESFASTYGLEQELTVVAQLSDMLATRLSAIPTPALLIRVSLTLENQPVELDLFDGQTVPEAINAFFIQYSVPASMQPELISQLEPILNERVNDFLQKQARDEKYAFTLPLNLAGQQFQLNHYDGASPLAEAQEFCIEQRILPELHAELIPGIAELIQNEILRLQQPTKSAQPRVLVTVPISMNDEQFTMNHYHGYVVKILRNDSNGL